MILAVQQRMAAAKFLRLRKALPVLRQRKLPVQRMMRLVMMKRRMTQLPVSAPQKQPSKRTIPLSLLPKIARRMTHPLPMQLRRITAQARHLIFPLPRCRFLRTVR